MGIVAIPLVLAFCVGILGSPAPAFAADHSNIPGITDRLESIRCSGGYRLTRAQLEKLMARRACQVADPKKAAACLKRNIPRSVRQDSKANLTITEIPGTLNFAFELKLATGIAISGLHQGIHADGELPDGSPDSSLLFIPVGNQEAEPTYVGGADPQGIAWTALVPLQKQAEAESFALFLNGCPMRWKPLLNNRN